MVFVDSEYLQQTVGPPLAGGCAATAAARPADPVEHLANWLLRCCVCRSVCFGTLCPGFASREEGRASPLLWGSQGGL